jgi:alanine-glyoxylate transaminase/serine-glyoxylate transaminase/serine-pyruvate transaminase
MVRQYWGSERAYHHTAPINMLYGLHEALGLVLEEGLPARFERHRTLHEHLCDGLAKLGIDYLSAPEHRLPMLNAVGVPAGIDDARIRRQLLDLYNLEIGGGLGAFRGRAWRIGLMGHTATRRNVALLLAALADLIQA